MISKCPLPSRHIVTSPRWICLAVALVVAPACAQDPAAAKAAAMKKGTEYFTAGKYAEALIEFRSAQQNDPQDGEVRLKLAETYLRIGDFAKAIEESVRAGDLRPDDSVAQLRAGALLLRAARFEDARDRAEKVLSKDTGNVEAHVMKANALAGLKDGAGALEEIEDAIEANPDRGITYTNLGALQLSRGNRAEAEQAFKKAAELDPKSAAPELALGNFYWVLGDFAAAEQHLKRATELNPEDPLSVKLLAGLYLATGRLDLAEAPLKRLADQSKTAPDRFALAEYYLMTRKVDAARAILEPMENDAATSAEARVRLATLDYRSGNRTEAYRRLDSVISEGKSTHNAQLVRARFLLNDGQLEEAYASVKAAVGSEPASTAAQFMLGRVQTARNQPDAAIAAYQEALRLNPRLTDARVALAQLRLAQGDLDTSVQMAREALAADPTNADAQLLVARGLVARNEFKRADQELQRLAARFPNSVAVQNEMGMLAGHQGNAAAAKSHFDRAVQLQPTNDTALMGLVALDLAAGRNAEARRRIDARRSTNPTAPLLTLAARTYAATHDREAAEKALRQAIEIDTSYLPAYVALGSLYIAQNRLDEATKEFEALSSKSPRPEAGRTMLGILKEAAGDTAGARAEYERVLDLNPDAGVAANNLAWLLSESGGNLDVALDLARRASRNLPDSAPVNHTLGTIYLKKDLATLSVAALVRAVEQDASNPNYQLDLGRAYAKAGDLARARRSVSRALEINPKFTRANEARQFLNTL